MPHAISTEATEPDKETVFAWLRNFNEEENGAFMRSRAEGAEKEFFLLARDEAGTITGGLLGSTIHEWVKISIMAVDPQHRGKGIGTQLVTHAEEHGIASGCKRSYVDTMSYQAPGFYEKLGYTVAGRLSNWDSHGHDKCFFSKELSV